MHAFWTLLRRGLAAAVITGMAVTASPGGASAQDLLELGRRAVEDALSSLSGNAPRKQGRANHTIIILGTGGGSTRYTISGGGDLAQVQGRIHGYDATIGPNDTVRGTRAEGGVSTGADAFLVYGRLPDIVLNRPRAARILVNGGEFHTIVIDGRAGAAGRTAYSIFGGGRLQQVNGPLGGLQVSAQGGDAVRGSRADGVVDRGLDGYRVFGRLPDVQLDRPNRANIIIDQVQRGGSRPPGRPGTTPQPGGSGPNTGPGPDPGPRASFVTVQYDTDFFGGDYRNFALDGARPNQCIAECNRDDRCRAYTYVPPGVHSPAARCWLKERINEPRQQNGMIAGAKRSPLKQSANTDRRGGDYRNFTLRAPQPTRCAQACANENRCRAYTFVPAGVQGPEARCWLKDRVAQPSRAVGMVSGVK